jgi:hypothetical protein
MTADGRILKSRMRPAGACKMSGRLESRIALAAVFICCALVFSLFTVFAHVRELGFEYIEDGRQLKRHTEVISGTAPSPWQYRVLSEYMVEGVIVALKKTGAPRPTLIGFISFRVFQNALLFLLAAYYYRKLGLNTYLTLIGLSMLAWGMSYAYFDSDLQFNTYSDVALYLAAALLILHKRYPWIILVTGVAALNRETSGLIPLLLISEYIAFKEDKDASRKIILTAGAALALYAIIFFSLRYAFGPRELFVPHGMHQGLELLKYNLFYYRTWFQLFATLGILPVLALVFYRKWPYTLKAFFWIVVPIWTLVHLLAGVMAETRLFLVPLSLVIVPGALFGLINGNERE